MPFAKNKEVKRYYKFSKSSSFPIKPVLFYLGVSLQQPPRSLGWKPQPVL